MTLTADIHKQAVKLTDTLAKNGINAKPYSRGPIAPELFTLNLDPSNLLRTWPGTAEIDLAFSPKRRQAVMTVEEGNRVIERAFTVPGRSEEKLITPEFVRQRFPIVIPGGVLAGFDTRQHQDRYGYPTTRITAQMRAPHTVTSFLLGFDETRQFICELPEKVDTVAEAHNVLRPYSTRRGTIRQGEWFFVPATLEEQKAIESSLRARPRLDVQPLETHSTHHAAIVDLGPGPGRRFATGLVYDTRTGRHAPTKLDGWFRVRRNREVTRVHEPARRTYWD